MKESTIKKISLGLVLVSFVIGAFLRLYKVPQIPPSLSWDEVSIGYNAFSILKTGRDEHQKFMPITAFAAYGDYKPVIPIYLTVPSVAIFGLTEFAVRLPSIVAGLLTIPVVFGIATELVAMPMVGALAALFLAISPWHINLSRAGFEANIATLFIGFGVWLVLHARKSPKLWIVSWIPFVLSLYTFNSARYFAPLLGIGLVIYCLKDIKKNIRLFTIGVIVAAVISGPLVPFLLSKEARLRFTEVNIFSDASVVEMANSRIAADGDTELAKLIHNRRFGYAREYLVHFFDNLEPWFLFVRGDGNPKFSIQDVGQLYLIEAPLLLFGLFWVFRNHPRVAWLLVYWLVMAIVPAATARETPHALRIENSLPTWQIFIAFGIFGIISESKKRWKNIVIAVIITLYVLNVAYYAHNYFGYYPVEYSGEWQYGYREAVRFITPLKKDYQSVVMTDVIGRPYMYALFYEQYDPRLFWQTVDASFDSAGFYNVYGFDAYRFIRGGIIGDLKKNTLYIMPANEVPGGVRILNTIKLLNGVPILTIFDKP